MIGRNLGVSETTLNEKGLVVAASQRPLVGV